MSQAVTGIRHKEAEHSPTWGRFGFALSMLLPAAVIPIGIAVEGIDAISWAGAIVWGIVATIVFTMVSLMGKAMGMTSMDLLDLLGSSVARPHTRAAKALGGLIHHMNGAVLAVAWAYGAVLIGTSANWVSGAAWGAILWVLALLMMSTMGSVHPAIRRGEQDDPGPAATNFGTMTPVGSLMGHLVYGIVLGLTYNGWPLA